MWAAILKINTIPAIATALSGVLTGLWLRSRRTTRAKVAGMLAVGVAGMVVGAMWNQWFPINKNVWTSSFVVVTAGFALVFLSLLYWIIEIREWRDTWTMPFLVFGMNAIVGFCFDQLLWVPLSYGHAHAADDTSITWQQYLNGQLLKIGSPANASLLFAVGTVLFCWALMWLLYRRRIFVKL